MLRQQRGFVGTAGRADSDEGIADDGVHEVTVQPQDDGASGESEADLVPVARDRDAAIALDLPLDFDGLAGSQ
ncbi:hypothetical protein AB0D12_36050 [Streptomyces sp. NPDC048479]|uniref:hypothetical protein n=1 Tax=Streptomyces sp. NPDC048479 TaxID=3154725 RepID=UPI00343A7639